MNLRTLLPPTLLILTITIVMLPYLAGYVGITPHVGTNDLTDTQIPFRALLQRDLATGQFPPLWEPTISAGFPFFAEGQSGSLHPLNILVALIPLPSYISTALSIYLALGISAVGMYIYIKNWLREKYKGNTHNTIYALFGAFVWSLNGFHLNHIAHLNVLNVIALLPWQLVLVDKIRSSSEKMCVRKQLLYGVLLALTVALQVLAGHPQFFAYSIIFINIYWIANELLTPTEQRLKKLSFSALTITTACILGLSIGAVQILPTLEFTQNSTRQAGLTDESINFLSWRIKDISSLIAPFYDFTPEPRSLERLTEIGWPFDERYSYMGIIPLFLALTAIPFAAKDRRVLIFTLSGAFFFLLAFGQQSPLGILLKIPPFNMFRIPAKFTVFFQLAATILAVHTLTILVNKAVVASKQTITREKKYISIILIALCFITVLDTAPKLHRLYPLVEASWWYETLQTVQTYQQEITANGHNTISKWYTERIIGQNYNEQLQKQYLKQDPKLWENQVQLFKNNRELIPASNMLYYDVPLLTNAVNSLGIKVKWVSDIENILFFTPVEGEIPAQYKTLMRLSGAKYVIHDNAIIDTQIENRNITSFKTGQDQIGIYAIKKPLPFIQVPQNIKYVPQNDTFKALVEDFNPDKDMILTREDKDGETDTLLQTDTGKISFLPINKTKMQINTNFPKETYILIRQAYYPGWEAKTATQKLKVLRADHAFQGLKVPPGEQHIVLSYTPHSFWYGAYISITASIVWIILACTALILKKLQVKRAEENII